MKNHQKRKKELKALEKAKQEENKAEENINEQN